MSLTVHKYRGDSDNPKEKLREKITIDFDLFVDLNVDLYEQGTTPEERTQIRKKLESCMKMFMRSVEQLYREMYDREPVRTARKEHFMEGTMARIETVDIGFAGVLFRRLVEENIASAERHHLVSSSMEVEFPSIVENDVHVILRRARLKFERTFGREPYRKVGTDDGEGHPTGEISLRIIAEVGFMKMFFEALVESWNSSSVVH